jgi:hypothetical protein
MTTRAESWLALDVGGANIKAAFSGGAIRSNSGDSPPRFRG